MKKDILLFSLSFSFFLKNLDSSTVHLYFRRAPSDDAMTLHVEPEIDPLFLLKPHLIYVQQHNMQQI